MADKEKIGAALDSIEAKNNAVSGLPPDISEELATLRDETGAPTTTPPAPEPVPVTDDEDDAADEKGK